MGRLLVSRPAVLAVVLLLVPSIPAGAAVGPGLLADPSADFSWSPVAPRSQEVVTFVSEASGPLPFLAREFRFESPEGSVVVVPGESVDVAFGRPGVYQVTHSVTDLLLRTSNVTRAVLVSASPPVAGFAGPSVVYRGEPAHFVDTSFDVDGDAIVSWAWDLGDGATATSRSVVHVYSTLGTKTVSLTVLDERGDAASVARAVRVLNHPPVLADAQVEPSHPQVGVPATFSASATDPDTPGEVEIRWRFNDGLVLGGAVVERVFERAGNHSVSVVAIDAEGGQSAPRILAFRVVG